MKVFIAIFWISLLSTDVVSTKEFNNKLLTNLNTFKGCEIKIHRIDISHDNKYINASKSFKTNELGQPVFNVSWDIHQELEKLFVGPYEIHLVITKYHTKLFYCFSKLLLYRRHQLLTSFAKMSFFSVKLMSANSPIIFSTPCLWTFTRTL